MTTPTRTVADYLTLYDGTPFFGLSYFDIADTAANIETLTQDEFAQIQGYTVVGITATDASVVLTVDQALGLELQQGYPNKIVITVPAGDSVSVSDSYTAIHSLTLSQLTGFASFGVTTISANDLVPISVADYVSDVNTLIASGNTPNNFSAIVDTAANIESLTAAELSAAGRLGLGQIVSTGGSLVLNVAQALALENNLVGLRVPVGDTVVINDTAANLLTLTAAEVSGFGVFGISGPGGTAAGIQAETPFQFTVIGALGFTAITVTDGPVTLTAAQAEALETAAKGQPLSIQVPAGDTVTLSDSVANIQSLTQAQVAALLSIGVTAIVPPALTPINVADYLNDIITFGATGNAPNGPIVIVDTATNIEALTPAELLLADKIGLGQIVSADGSVLLTTAQAVALMTEVVPVIAPPGDVVTIVDSSGQVSALTSQQNLELPQIGVTALPLNISQIKDKETSGTGPAPYASYSIDDYAHNIAQLTPADIVAAGKIGVSLISVFEGSGDVQLSLAQAQALETAYHGAPIPIFTEAGKEVSVTETAAAIQSLTPSQTEGLGSVGVNTLIASDQSVVLSVARAAALETADQGGPIEVTVPSGDTVTLSDSQLNIATLTLQQVIELPSIGVNAIQASGVTPISFQYFQSIYNIFLETGAGSAGSYNLTASAADIESLTEAQIGAAGPVGLSQITATDGPVYLTAGQALALEENAVVVSAANGDPVVIADTASRLEGLTPQELGAMALIGVTAVAATDQPAVFSAAQMKALGDASIPVIPPPNDPTQNDGSIVITDQYGTGLTYDISFDPSTASAPVGFVSDVVAAFQFYANLFSNQITLYYTVGYGNFGNRPLGSGALGENQPPAYGDPNLGLTYTALRQQMLADASSPAQVLAAGTLPATDPTGGADMNLSPAEQAALMFPANTPTASASNPDDVLGITDTNTHLDFTVDPSDVTNDDYGVTGALEHEISEGMGRASQLNTSGTNSTSSNYAPIDLFRYAAGPTPQDPAGTRQLTTGAPSYFSINEGATNLDNWNNPATGDGGDLADWAPTAGDDSYDDVTYNGADNPVTPTDIVLMNVLGYNVNPVVHFNADYIEALTPAGIAELGLAGITNIVVDDNSIVLTVAQAVAFEINPTSLVVPAGDTITVADTYGNILPLTPTELAGLASIGVTALTLADTAANIEAIQPVAITSFPGIGITAIVSTDTSVNLSAAQAIALWGDDVPAVIRITAPAGDGIFIKDTAANIDQLPSALIPDLPNLGISAIIVTAGVAGLTVAQASAALSAGVLLLSAPGATIVVEDTAANILDLTGAQQNNFLTHGVTGFVIADKAAKLEALQPVGITNFPGLNIVGLVSTDASVSFNESQTLALAGDNVPVIVQVSAPAGDSVTLTDTGANIALLPASVLAQLPSMGFTGIVVTSGTLALTLAEALTIEAASFTLTTPAGSPVIVSGSAAAIDQLTPAQIAGLSKLDVATLISTDGEGTNVFLTVAQVQALEGANIGVTILNGAAFPGEAGIGIIQDAGANIATLTLAQINGLAGAGIGAIVSTDGMTFPSRHLGSVALTIGQALALAKDDIPLTVPAGDTITVGDTIASILALTTGQLASLKAYGVTGFAVTDSAADIQSFFLTAGTLQFQALATLGVKVISANDASVQLVSYLAVELEEFGLSVRVPSSDEVSLATFGPDILYDAVRLPPDQDLTLGEISGLPAIGVTEISLLVTSGQVDVAQARALAAASLPIVPSPSTVTVTVVDTIANLLSLTNADLTNMDSIGIFNFAVSDSAADIEALTPSTIPGLLLLGWVGARSLDVTSIAANDAPVTLTAAQAAALESGGIFTPVVSAPAGDSVTLADTLANLQSMTADVRAGLAGIGVTAITLADTAANLAAVPAAAFGTLPSLGVSLVAATDTSLSLSVAQAVAIEGLIKSNNAPAPVRVTAPAGDAAIVADTPAQIASMTRDQIGFLADIGIHAIQSNGSVGLTVAQVSGLDSNISLSAVPGDAVTIVDTASNIDSLFSESASLAAAGGAAEITPLGNALQYSNAIAITATDAPLVLTVTEAELLLSVNAALDISASLAAPAGDLVVISDTEAQIDTLTAADLVSLAAAGVNEISVAGLAGLAPLNIAGGITLAIDGAVPSAETVVFSGAGVLSLDDAPGFTGTIDGFSPLGAIDLTGAAYDPGAAASLNAATNLLTVTENSGTYRLQLDPAQVFPTTPDFVLGPDSGTGTEITVTEAPVTTAVTIEPGQDVAGLVVASGGAVEVAGGDLNAATVQNGGSLMVDNGGTVTSPTIEAGGTLDVAPGGIATGVINFGPTVGDPIGGTLDIGGTVMPTTPIANMAPGDVIDLTAIGYDPAGSAMLAAGNTLMVIEGGVTYGLTLDPAQIFLGQSFTLSADGSGNGSAINELAAPFTGATTIPGSSYAAYAEVANGGAVEVRSGGIFDNGLIEDGGTVTVDIGASLGTTIGFGSPGGTLAIDGTVMPTATITGYAATDTIVLAGITDATSASVVNGDTLQIQRFGGPAISLALDPSQTYTGDVFTISDGTLTNNVSRTLTWTGSVSAAFGATANWNDVSDALNPAQMAPDPADTVVFNSANGEISGAGIVSTVDVGANGMGVLELDGGATLRAALLDAGDTAADIGQIGLSGMGTGLLVTGSATVADDGTGVLSVLNGATFSAANLTIGSLSDSSGALVVSGAGSLLSISGELNIGTALGTGDLTVGPGAVVNASVVNLQGGVVLEGGLLDPTVYIENGGSTTSGNGTIASDFILLEGTILSNGSKVNKSTEVLQGTIVGGGTSTIAGTTSVNTPGILQMASRDTIEVTGAVLNATTTTFTDNLTPTGTYTVINSVIDVVFQDGTGVLQLDEIGGFAGTIASWHAGDDIIITGGTLSGLGVSNGNTLTVNDSGLGARAGGSDTIIFGSAINAGGFNILNGNTVQAVACFAAGTRIETDTGPVSVEQLAVGDLVPNHLGLSREIIWIGSRTIDCRRHPSPEKVWPVRISAGAFGENIPERDLYLSPDHAVFVNGVLVPVRLLINGRSIVQVRQPEVTYFHVELPRHDVILAEGLPVESYLDLDDRSNFHRADEPIRLLADFSARFATDAALMWETHGAAPLVMTGTRLEAARRMVLGAPAPDHSETVGFVLDPVVQAQRSKSLTPERLRGSLLRMSAIAE